VAALALFTVAMPVSIEKDIQSFKLGFDNAAMARNFEDASRRSTDAKTQQLGTYYAARYRQRRYELAVSQVTSQASRGDLGQAVGWFEKFSATRDAARSSVASDNYFYYAMCRLYQGSTKACLDTAGKINPNSDSLVFVDDIVWTVDRKYRIGKNFKAGALRDKLTELVRAQQKQQSFVDAFVEQIATGLRAWCSDKRNQVG
jgi:hypothetical protein